MAFKSKYTGTQIEGYLDAVPKKQDVLVSGENIKTINGQSIVGSGDITIEGGGEVDTSSLEKVVAAGLTDLDTRLNIFVNDDSNIKADIKADIKALQDDSMTRATKVEVKESDDNITAEMTSNERVTAAALLDLQLKMQGIIARLETLENK